MKKIKSFSVNHDTLEKGLYISRIDGDVISLDMRLVKPNTPPYLENDGLHTFEHLFATYVRNSKYSDNIIYFGPMGCRTGFYFLVRDSINYNDIIKLVQETCLFISNYDDVIPGNKKEECGNYLDHDLDKVSIVKQNTEDSGEVLDIDDKEARNHMAILFDSLYIPKNVEILKQYIISILKSNGKYALSVFWKTPEELLFSIDDLVEGGLENVIATHPEVLGMSTEQLLRRAKFCEQEGKDVFTDSMRSETHDYITKPEKFGKQFGYVTLPELTERNTTNGMLANVIGNPDYVEILLNTLEDYYSNTDTYTVPEIDDSLKDTYENLCHYLEEKGNAKLAGKFTYDIDGVSICKNKLERHIAVILNALTAADQPINGVEREIALVAALYNSRLTEEQLRKVAGSCLGFNSNAQEVITL